MCSHWVAVIVAASVLGAAANVAAAEERFEDAVGDATGDSPDIVAVTVSEPAGEPTVRFEIEMAPERVFGSDGETWTDTVFVMLSDDGEVDDRGIIEGGYTIGLHGLFLDRHEDTGAFLVTEDEVWWYVVDVETDEAKLTLTLDRKLIGDPDALYWQLLMGVERFEDASEVPEGDSYPEEGDPAVRFELDREW